MEAAFAWQPDVVFIISDGDFQRTNSGGGSQNVPWEDLSRGIHLLQQESEKDVRLHFVGFQVKEAHQEELKSLVRKYKGQYREL